MTDEVKTPVNGGSGQKEARDVRPDPSLPTDFSTWPTANHVAKYLKCGVRTANRLADQGELIAYVDIDGCRRFDPQVVKSYHSVRFNQHLGVDDDGDEDPYRSGASAEIRQAQRQDKVTNANVRRLDVSNELVEILLDAVQRLINSVAGPSERLLDKHDRLNARIVDRNEYLENLAFRMLKTQEEAINERHARELAEAMFRASEDRKNEAWKLIMSHAPRLLNQIEASILEKNPEAKAQVEAAIQLLTSPEITPQMLGVIKEFLSRENQDLLDKIIEPDEKKRKAKAEAQAKEAATSGSEQSESTDQQTKETKP